MAIKYVRYELLELFDDMEDVDETLEITNYYAYSSGGLKIKLFLDPSKKQASFQLQHKAMNVLFYDISLHSISRIEKNKENALEFYKNEDLEPAVTLQVKPTFSLSCYAL